MTKFGLVMIVKNEAGIIEKCLSSVAPYISRFDICDTGSTDNTIQIIETFFQSKGITGKVHQHEWKGFADNRSRAFEEAEKHCDWMYVIDADDYLLTPLEIPPENANAQSLVIDIEEGPHVTQTRQQLFKSGCKWGYSSIVHEFPFSRKFKTVRVEQTHKIKVRASRGGDRSKDPLKYWKDAQLMEQDLLRIEKIPKNRLEHWETGMESRYHYYIAQSYFDFRDYASCLKWCESRVKLNGFKEEIYRAYLMRGRCLRGLKRPHAEIIKAFEQCHKYDPYRAEAMFELAVEYELMGNIQMAWDKIQASMKIKRPTDKFFIVEDYIYQFANKLKAGVIARKLGKIEVAYKYLHSLWQETDDDYKRKYVFSLKHEMIPDLVSIYKNETVNFTPSSGKNIIVNINFSDSLATIECLTTFLATCVDHSNIDKIYISKHDETVLSKFPWLFVGRETGTGLTINMDDTRLWFHKFPMITFILESSCKILFLNKDGKDDLKNCEKVNGNILMNGIQKSPYAICHGQEKSGIWSTDFLCSVSR